MFINVGLHVYNVINVGSNSSHLTVSSSFTDCVHIVSHFDTNFYSLLFPGSCCSILMGSVSGREFSWGSAPLRRLRTTVLLTEDIDVYHTVHVAYLYPGASSLPETTKHSPPYFRKFCRLSRKIFASYTFPRVTFSKKFSFQPPKFLMTFFKNHQLKIPQLHIKCTIFPLFLPYIYTPFFHILHFYFPPKMAMMKIPASFPPMGWTPLSIPLASIM